MASIQCKVFMSQMIGGNGKKFPGNWVQSKGYFQGLGYVGISIQLDSHLEKYFCTW